MSEGQKNLGRSPPQELEVSPRSGLYLLVIVQNNNFHPVSGRSSFYSESSEKIHWPQRWRLGGEWGLGNVHYTVGGHMEPFLPASGHPNVVHPSLHLSTPHTIYTSLHLSTPMVSNLSCPCPPLQLSTFRAPVHLMSTGGSLTARSSHTRHRLGGPDGQGEDWHWRTLALALV